MSLGSFLRRRVQVVALASGLALMSLALPLADTLAQNDVQVQVLGQGVQATAGGSNLVNPTTSVSTTVTLAASEWTGGYYQGNGAWYGRPWAALYGTQTQYSTATVTIQLSSTPTGPVTLTLTGLNDESGTKNPINITINGTSIFNGTSWFASWDGSGQGENAPWTTVAITIPASYFALGANSIAVSNLTNSSNFSQPPYVLLGAAQINLPGASASVN
ncbi:MAG: hypothetical protein KC438_02235 [Thermomicrobiales bacterium]|nr:hypothetical protein [Thermomicrobiales bacterium]MCO5222682.1 hypothetical protein [Thermomicrobiales bacterium]